MKKVGYNVNWKDNQVSIQMDRSNINLKDITERKDSKKQQSNLYQGVLEKTNKSRQLKKQIEQKNSLSKSKIDRKDTRQTDPTTSQCFLKNQQIRKSQQMDNLILKSQQDPFLRRKLQNMMLNDIKSLKRLNGQNKVTDTPLNTTNVKLNGIDRKQDSLYYNEALNSQYGKIPKDISIIISNSGLELGDLSLRSIDSQTPLSQRLLSDFTHQESSISKNNQIQLNNNFTTLRTENYKQKLSRLQSLQQIKLKQINQTQGTQCKPRKSSQGMWITVDKLNRSQRK